MAIMQFILDLGGEVLGLFYKKLPWYVYLSILIIGLGLSVYLEFFT